MISEDFTQFYFQQSLNDLAIKRALEIVDSLGRALPCKVTAVNGAVVTVVFFLETTPWVLPEISIPKAESPWIRMPTQVGDLGIAVPAGAYLTWLSGLGNGQVSIQDQPGNLAALYFVPISNVNSPPPNENAATVQGPDGAIIQTTEGSTPSSVVTNQNGTTVTFGSTVLVVEAGQISMTAGGQTVVLNSSGFSIGGIEFGTHEHTGVTTGSGNTGGPIAG